MGEGMAVVRALCVVAFCVLLTPVIASRRVSVREEVEWLAKQVDELSAEARRQDERLERLEKLLEIRGGQDSVGSRADDDFVAKLSDLEKATSSLRKQVNTLLPRPKNCEEIRLRHPEAASGTYWVDPDGHGSGEPPFRVRCNMTSGATLVGHDSQNPVATKPCHDPGCYSRAIKYEAPMSQLAALISHSAECRQSIRYDCSDAPFKRSGFDFSWWQDREGRPQFYWAGSQADTRYCQCGIDDNCVANNVNCNCDSASSANLTDFGYITNKTALPVTGLRFGRISGAQSWSRHSVGPLECTGFVSFHGLPRSCADLKRHGHTLNAFYTVHDHQVIYCDMNQIAAHRGAEAVLYFTTGKDLHSWSLDSERHRVFNYGTSQSHSLAVDSAGGAIYWSDKMSDDGGIFRAKIGETTYESIIFLGSDAVETLALDWVAHHIYYADSGRKEIVACDMHGMHCAVVVRDRLHSPRAVALHPRSRTLFWTDWGLAPHIGSAGMDGSAQVRIVDKDVAWPNGLTVDDASRRIFWCDAKLSRIESSALDGSGRFVLDVHVQHPYGIDVFDNSIYWTEPMQRAVHSCNKFTGKNHRRIVTGLQATPTGVRIAHPSKEYALANPCGDHHHPCSHLCLLSPSVRRFRCACPAFMKLAPDGATCLSLNSI